MRYLLLVLFLVGCGEKSPPPAPKPPVEVVDFAWIPFSGTWTADINAWLHVHPQKRIVGIAGNLKYRSGLNGIIIQIADGRSSAQKAVYVSCNNEPSYLSTLQRVHTQTTHKVVAFTADPSYSGGSDGFLVILEEQ